MLLQPVDCFPCTLEGPLVREAFGSDRRKVCEVWEIKERIGTQKQWPPPPAVHFSEEMREKSPPIAEIPTLTLANITARPEKHHQRKKQAHKQTSTQKQTQVLAEVETGLAPAS